MGGNLRIQYNSCTYNADKIDLNIIKRNKIKKEILALLNVINDLHKVFYKDFIWKDIKYLNSNKVFNGSSELLFDKSILDREFKKFKPQVGDIDLTLPEETKNTLWSLLKLYEGKFLTPTIKYLGNNRKQNKVSQQLNALFEFNLNVKINVQIDFEFCNYINDKADEFSKFSHSASLLDLRAGIKAGIFHKYILRACTQNLETQEGILVSNKSNPNKFHICKTKGNLRIYSFSVDKGLRVRYIQQFLSDGSEWIIDNKKVYKEIPIDKSYFERNLKKIYNIIFREFEYTQEQPESFIGVLEIIQNDNTILKSFFNLLYSKGAQIIERDNLEADRKIKNSVKEFILRESPYFPKEYVNSLEKEYYERLIDARDKNKTS